MKPGKFVTLLALALSLGMLLSLVPSTSGAFAQSASQITAKGAAQVAQQAVHTQSASPVQQTGVNYIPWRFRSRVFYPRYGRFFYPRYYWGYSRFFYPRYWGFGRRAFFGRRFFAPRFYRGFRR